MQDTVITLTAGGYARVRVGLAGLVNIYIKYVAIHVATAVLLPVAGLLVGGGVFVHIVRSKQETKICTSGIEVMGF
jgi:hypothetical protein